MNRLRNLFQSRAAVRILMGLLVVSIVFASWLMYNAVTDNSATERQVTSNHQTNELPTVPVDPKPAFETESFHDPIDETYSDGDVADDSVVWANPEDPAKSVVIADNKSKVNGGIAVFDMSGKMLQFRQVGSIGNVDLRSDFQLDGKKIVLIGANNRSESALEFWELNPDTRQLTEPVTARSIQTFSKNYGFCMYHSANSGKYYAFVTQDDSGNVEQYELFDSNGKVDARKVRTFSVGSRSEGCVADDERGKLYIGEEDIALWQYGAEPDDGTTRIRIDSVSEGRLTADVEGVALAYGPNGTGYLIVSCQGSSELAIYDRESNEFIRKFSIGPGEDIDSVQKTDGVAISTDNLGPDFPHGILVVHDSVNSDGNTSNLKYVPLQGHD